MTRRSALLSELQLKTLQWVADGCPDGVWEDLTYKRIVYTLADRKLVAVDRRPRSWQATITAYGRYYLEHGSYDPEKAPRARTPGPRVVRRVSTPTETGVAVVTPRSLLSELEIANGTLTVPDPPKALRAAYRSAVSRAISDGLVPSGYALRHRGRDRGDLVVRLVRLDEAPARAERLSHITVPKSLEGVHETVAALRDNPELLNVSGNLRDRALLIAQAIAVECKRHGYEFGLRERGEPSFRITIGEDRFPFILSEEWEDREVPDEEKAAAAKYPWQRIPSGLKGVRSGRLRLRLESEVRTASWADRRRWTLEQKLAAMFLEISKRAAAQVGQRRRREEERKRRREVWEDAIARARRAHVDQLNRDRLRDQATRSCEASSIREYCGRLDAFIERSDDPDLIARARRWAAWARREADRLDPINRPDQLRLEMPSEPSPADLERFMPRGLSAWRPPD